MKFKQKISFLICITLTSISFAQTVNSGYLNPTLGNGDPYLYLRFGNPNDYKAGFLWNLNAPPYGNGDDFSIFTYNNRDISFYTGTGNLIVFPQSGGNVGIGTVNPLEKFQVTGTIYLNSGSDYDNIFWARHNLNMGTRPGSYNHNNLNLKPGGASQGLLHSKLNMFIANSESNHVQKVQIHTDGNTYFNGGNVGIGTTNPDSKLTVAGNIHSREVKVTVNAGADFVFDDNYNLASLQEVQQFIQENGHLPEIASAKEMETNGIHLSEMNIKLLQKIEELTLYAIEQEEQNKLQNERIADLENKIYQLLKIIEK